MTRSSRAARTRRLRIYSLSNLETAYLILAHDKPQQLARLVAALPANSQVFVHFDLRARHSDYQWAHALLESRNHLRFVERHVCRWGAIGIVRATLSLIRAACDSRKHFDYAFLLSGADYPIKSHVEITTFLNQNRGKEFIESFSLTAPNRWLGQSGYFKAPERLLCRHFRVRSRVFRIPIHRTLPYGLLPFGGEQWWCLSEEAMRYIADFVLRHPRLLSFCKYSLIPDEAFIQVVLSNSYLAPRIAGDSMKLSIWDRPTPPYPAILGVGDLDTLVASNKLFARKFDMTKDGKILDELDHRLKQAPKLGAA